ncbi:MAG: hypothetical protein M3016_09730 [Actinomycetota bacterium]|nr:hypothetical protein [Actinomycetota bacterium]
MKSAADGQAALAEELRTLGGSAAACLRAAADLPQADERHPGPAQLAAGGPRAAGQEREYELLLEMIYEGTRLHYGSPRVFAVADPDLRLLLGDHLYASGLARLAQIGDLEAVAELADLISLLAQAYAREQSELADAIWVAGARAIGWGGSPRYEAAKDLARGELEGARAALLSASLVGGS